MKRSLKPVIIKEVDDGVRELTEEEKDYVRYIEGG